MKKVTEFEAKKILARYGIPVTREFLAKDKKEALRKASLIKYPIVMKVMSPDILHKSDAGCVAVGVKSPQELEKTYDRLLQNAKKFDPKAKVQGILVQEMISGREVREAIIGSKHDEQFGPVIMFGLGGVFVEVLKDVTFRIIPIERSDAKDMLQEIKGHKILEGVRGQKPVNFKALEDCLLAVSRMVWANQKIKELDINPLFIDDKGVKAGDARMVMD